MSVVLKDSEKGSSMSKVKVTGFNNRVRKRNKGVTSDERHLCLSRKKNDMIIYG